MPSDLCINYLMHFPAIEAIQAKFATFMFFASSGNYSQRTSPNRTYQKLAQNE